MANFSTKEIEDAFIAALEADTDFVALLHDSEAIHRGYPPDAKPFPLITIEFGSRPDNGNTGVKLIGEWTISIFDDSDRVLRDILGYLDANYRMPERRNSFISSDNWDIRSFQRVGAVPAGPLRLTDTGEQIQALHTEWRAKLYWTGAE